MASTRFEFSNIVVGVFRMIFVCGISASGKSSIVSGFTDANRGFSHVKGSALLERAGRPIRNLSGSSAESNQRVLLDTLRSEQLIGPLTILDGHITIETTEGIFIVPNWFFQGAEIVGIICITNDPLIIERRRKEKRLFSAVAIESLQEAEKSSAKERARELGIVCREVSADDQDGFEAAVSGILDHQ